MSSFRAVSLALLVVGSVLAAAVPAGAAAVADDSSTPRLEDADASTPAEDARPTESVPPMRGVDGVRSQQSANDSSNTSLGADISAFMQSSAAEIGGAIEDGMWTAAFNGTDNRSVKVRMVQRRTKELQKELKNLRQRRSKLLEQHEADEISEVRYKAKMSHLLGRINALQEAIDTTTPRARQVGVEVTQLRSMQQAAKNLSGPAIAAVARNTTGVAMGKIGDRPVANAATNGSRAGNGSGAGNGTAGGPLNEVAGNGDGAADGNESKSVGVGTGDAVANASDLPAANGTGDELVDGPATDVHPDSEESVGRFFGVAKAGILARTFVGTLF